jgi:hypothetical protein
LSRHGKRKEQRAGPVKDVEVVEFSKAVYFLENYI